MDDMNETGTPTEEGKKRHPPDGLYEDYACTCTESCRRPCNGQCGCKACGAAYSDFLSCE